MIPEQQKTLDEALIALRTKSQELWHALNTQLQDPPILFHYTSPEAAFHILTDATLFATEVLCMSDPTEGIHAGRLIAEQLNRRATDVPEHLVRLFSDREIAEVLNNQVFVLSFCDGGDLLNQWRAYGLDGRGYALGFDTHALRHCSGAVDLVPVSYDPSQLQSFLREMVDFGVSEITRITFQEDAFNFYWTYLGNQLLNAVTRFKNPVFRDEREWRLFAAPSTGVHFRPVSGRILPYARLPFSRAAVRCIWLGPRCSAREKRVLSNFCAAVQGDPLPEIKLSLVPLT